MRAERGERPGVFRTTVGSWTSITKFIHLSDNYAITFDCAQPAGESDVTPAACALSEAEVEVYSRRPSTPQTAVRVLKDILRQKSCVAVNRMDDMQAADTCPLTVTNQKSCQIDEIPLHPNVTVPLLAGPWFQIMRTKTATVLPGKHGEMFIDTTNHHLGRVTLHMRAKTGTDCEPAYRVQAYSSTLDRAHWLFMVTNSMSSSAGTLKIVYVDSNLLVLHTCLGPSPKYKALCDKTREAVQIYSHRRYLNSRDRVKVRDIVRQKLCVDQALFHRTTHTAHGPASCKVHDYTAQEDFEPRKFAGIWYEVERTRYSHGNIWESPITHIAHQAPNYLTFTHVGSREADCAGPWRAHLVLNARAGEMSDAATQSTSGEMTMWLGQRHLVGTPWSVHFPYKVIWTNYELAVVYSCHQMADSGRCRRQGEQVQVLSRSPEVSIRTRLRLYRIITKRMCVDVVDLVEPANEGHLLCQDNIGLNAAISIEDKCYCYKNHFKGIAKFSADCTSLLGLDAPSTAAPSATPGCDVIECNVTCSHGYAQNDVGCDVCECHPFTSEDGSGDVTPTKISCTNAMCFYLYCPYGFKLNENGCTICACAGRPETDTGSTVRLFWVNRGLGNYGIRRAIIEPYLDGLVSKKAAVEGNRVHKEDDVVAKGRAGESQPPVDADAEVRRAEDAPEEELTEKEAASTGETLVAGKPEVVGRADEEATNGEGGEEGERESSKGDQEVTDVTDATDKNSPTHNLLQMILSYL